MLFLLRVARTTHVVLWVHTPRTLAELLLYIDPRQYIMTTTDELLARLIILENEAVQARQGQNSAEHALAAAQQRIQQLTSGDGATSTSAGLIDTRTLGRPESFTGQTAEWTTWQFTFNALARAGHPERSLRPCYKKRAQILWLTVT